MKDSGGRPRLVLAELWCRPIGILLVAWVTPNLLAVAVIHRIFTLPAMGVLLHAGLLLGLLFWLALLPWAGARLVRPNWAGVAGITLAFAVLAVLALRLDPAHLRYSLPLGMVLLAWVQSRMLKFGWIRAMLVSAVLGSVQWTLLLFYGFSSIGLRTWGCWLNWTIVSGYLRQVLRPTQSWSPLRTLAESGVKRPRSSGAFLNQKAMSLMASGGGGSSSKATPWAGTQSGNTPPW